MIIEYYCILHKEQNYDISMQSNYETRQAYHSVLLQCDNYVRILITNH